MRVFSTPGYRPVWKCTPGQPEWQRVPGEAFYEPGNNGFYRYTWNFDIYYADCDYFFAYATPYSYSDIMKSIKNFEKTCSPDVYFFREIIILSIDSRPVELVTISCKCNFVDVEEERISGLFPERNSRCLVGKKPVVFITARVHPGETPASFLLDGVLKLILGNDPRGQALRSAFVFKIIPVLNPDGVYNGSFRVDQNGVNLNRCYSDPNESLHPTIFAAKAYFQYHSQNIKYYFDFHAHASKRSCFLFGNALELEKQIDNQLLAKLIEINTSYFEYSECDFSEKSMSSKDPKDHNTKEGSGRVALYKLSNIVHCYTIECAYFILRPLHPIAPPIIYKTGKRFLENANDESIQIVQVFNRVFFDDVSLGIMIAILDMEKMNPVSRLPLSVFRYLEAGKEWIKARILAHYRLIGKNCSRLNLLKSEGRAERATVLPRLPERKVHKMNLITPIFNEVSSNTSQNRVLFSLGRMVNRSIDDNPRYKTHLKFS